jgi:hypothetical protein
MAILDRMLLNALVMWNLSCDKVAERKELTRFEFLQAVAHELLHYKEETLVSPTKRRQGKGQRRYGSPGSSDDEPEEAAVSHTIVKSNGIHRCLVCNLELCQYTRIFQKNLELGLEDGRQQRFKAASKGVRSQVAKCEECCAHAHSMIPTDNKKFIHDMFPGLTCMDILHSEVGKEIWSVREGGRVAVRYGHPVAEDVRLAVEDYLMVEE